MTALVLCVGEGVVRAEVWRRGRAAWTGCASYGVDSTLVEAVTSLAQAAPRPMTRSVRVRLMIPVIQIRTLKNLPPVRKKNLRALLTTQFSQFFRAGGKQMVADAVWIKTTDGGRQVKAVGVMTDVVESVAAALDESGLSVASVEPVAGGLPGGLSLVPQSVRSARRNLLRQGTRWMTVAAALVWVLVGLVYVGDLVRDHRMVVSDLRALEGPLAQLDVAKQEVSRVAEMIQAVRVDDAARGWTTLFLAMLSETLPDSAFLDRMTVRLHRTEENDDGRVMADDPPDGTDPPLRSLASFAGRLEGTLIVVAPMGLDVRRRLERVGLIAPVIEGGAEPLELHGRARERIAVAFGGPR